MSIVEQQMLRDQAVLAKALLACVRAMRDVQDEWSDPGCWMHNRLETPLLVHEDAIKAAAALEGKP